MFNVYFFIIAHISKCAGSVIFLNNVRRSEKAVLRLRLVADVLSKIVLRNRVNFTILIINKTPAKAFTPPAKRKWAQGQAGL